MSDRPPASSPDLPGAAWSWVAHLRGGGTTPWARWVSRPHEPAPGGAVLPGAAELELVRRLAARSTLAPDAFAPLADVVLARSGPGRGLPQLPLSWPYDAPPARRTGAPATDPADVPAEELVRVGTGALAELLLRGPAPVPRGARRRPWTRPFRLLGAPVTAAGARSWLAAGGHVEGGRRPEVVLLAAPFDVLLAQAWSARVQRGAPVRWAGFVDRWSRRDELPPALRLHRHAARWARRVGPEHVHVVVEPDPVAARRTVSELLVLRGREPDQPPLRDLSLPAIDLLRRLNPVLAVRMPPERARAATREAAAVLAPGADPPPDPPVLPQRHLDWATAAAARLTDDLRAGGYAVHGDLDGLAVRPRTGTARPRHRDVRDLVLDACLALADRAPRRQEAQ